MATIIQPEYHTYADFTFPCLDNLVRSRHISCVLVMIQQGEKGGIYTETCNQEKKSLSKGA